MISAYKKPTCSAIVFIDGKEMIFLRLKSLELQGFKSFPDKTILSFNNGVTAVVGPNGSGKSNITDAVRWVLGEMSTKNIRTPKMEDIIFGGSASRKPMGYAEVSLVIDNTYGESRLDTEYDEVTVTRRYYRGGESEYMINRHPVRLKDIAELFMNTGIGKTGYSNIGQGKISEIISQRSEDRRGVFEEAAGISKYRYQKNEAERKLKSVNENSVRLGDILSDLEERVGPLEKEAAAAKKYLELYDQKKAVDISLWIYDANKLHEKGNDNELKYAASKLSLESIDGEIQDIEARTDKLYQLTQEVKQKAEELNRRIIETVNKKHDIELENRDSEKDIKYTEEKIAQLSYDSNAKLHETKEAKELVLSLSDKEKADSEKLTELTERIDGLKKSAEEKADLLSDIESRTEEAEIAQKKSENEIVELRLRLAALEGNHESDDGRSSGIISGIEELSSDVESFKKQLALKEKTIDEYNSSLKLRLEEYNSAQDEILNITGDIESIKAETATAQLDIASKRQKADSLRRMDELFEGYGRSVKAVMTAAESNRLSGICGPVSRMIKVGAEHAIAIETALGASLQNIITEDERAAKNAIAYLKNIGGGRATFYPITSVRAGGQPINERELKSLPGYVGIAGGLVSCDDKYRGIIDYLLGRTLVFDNLDSASDAAKRFSYRYKIVTSDGQQINAGGSYTGGSVKHDSGMLTRSAEIEKLTAEADEEEKNLKRLSDRLSELSDRLSGLKDKAQEENENIGLLNNLLSAEKTQLQIITSKKETAEKRLCDLRSDLESIGTDRKNYENEHAGIEGLIKSAEEKLSGITGEIEKLHLDYADADNALDDINRSYNSMMIEKTALEKDIEASRFALSSNRERLAALESGIAENERESELLKNKLSETKEKIRSNGSDYDSLSSEIEQIEQERQKYIDKTLENEKLETELRNQSKDKSHAREIIFRDYTKYEAAREQIKNEHDRLAAKIWDEYELTYSAACALEYPPVDDKNRAEYGSKQTELRSKIRSLGNVNVGAIDEYREVKEKYDFSKAQIEDLTKAQENLTDIISKIEKEMQVRFVEAVALINKHFKVVFRELFGGGDAEIYLTDPDNALESGIEIDVAPPGKIIKSLMTLSGGEQSFVAIALIFAILEVNPTPFCIFDEIESALDDVNVYRYAEYMKRYSDKTQFIVITHRRGTMESSDMLYGVTMPERGVSKVLGIDINEVEQKIGGDII